MDINAQGYLNYTNTPWGKLFYKLIWNHLDFKSLKILDFGSGFGITADHLAANNTVTAIEPDKELLSMRICNNTYTQIIGGIEQLKNIGAQTYDVVICHNVLEYTDRRGEILSEFHRILKKNGTLSLVKHNKSGKIMQKAVFEYNKDDALALLRGANTHSANFGTINEYEISDLEDWIKNRFDINKIYGVRMFFGLQRNEIKTESDWPTSMFELECTAEEIAEFRNIAFYHHILLNKV